MSERSFFFRGVQFPLCARCTGLLSGFVVIGPAVSVFSLGNIYLSVLFIFLMCADGLLQLKGYLMSTNRRRFVTGLAAGYALFSIAFGILRRIYLYFI